MASAQAPREDTTLSERAARLEWSGPQGELHRQLAQPLRAARCESASGPELLAQLLAPGADAIAPLLDILVQERVPRVKPDDAPQILSAPQRLLLLSALARLPADRLRAELQRRQPPPPAIAAAPLRLATLRVLALIGTHSDLPRLPALAPREHDQLTAAGSDALRTAYASILRREPALLGSGLKLLRACDPCAARELLFALGDLGDKHALGVLDACVRSAPEFAQQAVALVPLVGASGDPSLDQSLAAWLGGRLDEERPEWTRAALRAIGVLDDGSQVPVLLEQLDSPHPGLREAALWALQRISGLKLGESSAAWREWQAREIEWQEIGRPAAESALSALDDALVAQALGAYAERRLFRDQLAEDVLAVLEHGSPAMRVLACGTLARLGSLRALEPLIELFAEDDAALAEAAWRAACELCGQTLPRETGAAREQLAKS